MSLHVLTTSVNRGRYFNVLGIRAFNVGSNYCKKFDEDSLKKARPFKSIPKVPMIPLIGSAWSYLPYIGKYSVEKMHEADMDKNMTYGDMVREKFGRLNIVNFYHPDAMHTMMNDDDEYPSRGDFATLKAYRNERKDWYKPAGLLVTEGKEWKDLRASIQEYTSKPEFLEYYIEPMNKIARDFVEVIYGHRDRKEEIDATSLLHKWSLEAIGYVALDRRLATLEPYLLPRAPRGLYSFGPHEAAATVMKFIDSIEIQLDCMNKLEASAGNIPFWKYLPTPTWRKFVKAADTFTTLAFTTLTQVAFDAKQMKDEERRSLLQHLTRAGNAGVSAAMVVMADLMMAGVDTTAYTAGFLLYELAKHPEKQGEAVKEITKILSPTDQLTFEKYKDLKYLRNCLKESMRLHPIARGNVRIFKNDVVICGYRIPAGTAVICVLQVVYRNPRYFPMPHSFQPERWEGDENKYPFFQPFGYGARNCVGNTLAELEILTMVTEVLRHFTLEYHYEDIGMTTKLINTPDKPMFLRFQERLSGKPERPKKYPEELEPVDSKWDDTYDDEF